MKFFNKILHIGKPKLILGIGVLGTIVMLGIISAVIVSFSRTLQPVEVNKADVKLRTEVPHVENELVVRYQDGKSTADLLTAIERRENLAKTQVGRMRLGLENTLLNIANERTPEEDYAEIQEIFAKTRVIKQTKIFPDETLPLKNYYVLTFQSGTNLGTAQEIINRSSLFDFAQGNYIPQLQTTPNDPDYSRQWGYESISAPSAWDHTTGSRSVIIGIVDSGIEQSHPDIPSGVIGGPDYMDGQSSFIDTIGHGTHVGGITGAHSNNGIGVAGMNWDGQLMAIRVCKAIPYFPYNTCDPTGMVQGISYAVANGAKVINLSLGSGTPCSSSPVQQDTINSAISRGAVIVAAAGNNGVNAAQFSPASCTGLITVGALDQSNARSLWPGGQSSNYGARIDIAAPGSAILSTYKEGGYESSNGTSQAAPFVSGAAALLLSVNPSLKPQQVKDCIINSGDPITTDLPLGGRKLNVLRMLQQCGNVAAATDSPTPSPSPSVSPEPNSPECNQCQPAYGPPWCTFLNGNGTVCREVSPGCFQWKEVTGCDNGSCCINNSCKNCMVPPASLTATVTVTKSPTPTGVPKSSTPTVPAATPTPTGTVVQLYDCQPRTETRVVDGKQVQISWLDCKPL